MRQVERRQLIELGILTPDCESRITTSQKVSPERKRNARRSVKEKLLMLSRRFVPFAQNVGRNREKDNKGELRHQFAWPHVMNSSLAMHGPPVSRHHGYYRTRR